MKSARTFFTFAILFIVASASSASSQDSAKKSPVPAADAQAESTKLIKEVYGDEYSKAKTATEKQALAKKLLGKANETSDDPASKFVLLRLARDIATQATDEATAFQAVDAMAETFQVDALQMKAAVLAKLATTAEKPGQHKTIAEEALNLVNQAASEDGFTVADQLSKLALAEAQAADEKELLAQAQDRIDEVAEMTKAYEAVKAAKVKLQKMPDDPEGNLVVGKWLCFVKGDWAKGLPMLGAGSDDGLKTTAGKELAGAASSTDQAKLGDGWWDLAEKEEGSVKKQMQTRARYWYKQALPGLSGLTKDKAEARIGHEEQEPRKPIVLRYDWKPGQLDDWDWTGDNKPTVKDGMLRMIAGGELRLKQTRMAIAKVTMIVQTLDQTQAMNIFIGQNSYRLQFLVNSMWIEGGEKEAHANLSLRPGWRTVNISIPKTGNTTMKIGNTEVSAAAKPSGTIRINLDVVDRPVLIRQITIMATTAEGTPASQRAAGEKTTTTDVKKSDRSPIVGKWIRVGADYDKNVKEFQEDGTYKHNGSVAGKWKCLDKKARTYQALWSSRGAIDWWLLSPDGATLSGKNNTGGTFFYRRLRDDDGKTE